jgi:Calcium-dependent channel, 7TM region, putative phosphate
MGLIFCGTNPLIGMFMSLFFTIKYWIEKYNLTFVYNREFEGGGVIKK